MTSLALSNEAKIAGWVTGLVQEISLIQSTTEHESGYFLSSTQFQLRIRLKKMLTILHTFLVIFTGKRVTLMKHGMGFQPHYLIEDPGACCFMPVQRIACRCAYAQDLSTHKETVFVACLLSMQYETHPDSVF